jgi:hypothetical protein
MSCIKDVGDTYRHARAEKGLTEVLDYSFRYTNTFALVTPADTITAEEDSTWVLSGEGVLGATTLAGDITTAWISGGGKIGNTLRLTNTVVTAGGRTHVRVLIIKIVNRLDLIPEE